MFPGVISSDLEPHGVNGPVGSSFSNYQYPVIGKFFPSLTSLFKSKLTSFPLF
jgi:hypothetical protein